MRYCNKCGKEIPEDSAFCPFCGNSFGSEGDTKKPEAFENDSLLLNQTKASKKGKRAIILIATAAIVLVAAFLIIKFVFPGLLHKHVWVDATCTEPKTCSVCGETEGEALGHEWIEATCTEPKTCKRCGAKDGAALGHLNGQWQTVTEPTLSKQGKEDLICAVCRQVIDTRAIPTKEIKFSHNEFNFSREELMEYLSAGFTSNTGVQEEGFISEGFGYGYSIWDIEENSAWGFISVPENENGNARSVIIFGNAKSFFLMEAVLGQMTERSLDDQTVLDSLVEYNSYTAGNLRVLSDIDDDFAIFTIVGA